MEKRTAGLLGAVAGLAAMGTAHAAIAPAVNPEAALQASSYADLLAPVPNAMALIQADNAARTQSGTTDAKVEPVQYYYRDEPRYRHHHHHHHHHAYYRHHHHHHHHHAQSFLGIPGVGGVVVGDR